MTVGVVIAGLGRIGAGYPERSGMPARTHVGAVMRGEGLTLRAIVDPAESARAEAAAAFSLPDDVRHAASLGELPAGIADIVVLATPVTEREATMRAALALRPRLIFVEKPLAESAAAARRLVVAAAERGAEVRVNFQRRFDPGHARARAAFKSRPLAVQIRYAKGLSNYGSHLFDLLIDWLGPVDMARADGAPGVDEDRSLAFRLRFADGIEAVAIALDSAGYDVFDIDFFFAEGRLELSAGGAERRVWRPVDDLHYPGYRHLAVDDRASEESPVGGLTEFYAAARDHLTRGAPLAGCDGAAAARGLDVIEALRRSSARGGGWQTLRFPEPPAARG